MRAMSAADMLSDFLPHGMPSCCRRALNSELVTSRVHAVTMCASCVGVAGPLLQRMRRPILGTLYKCLDSVRPWAHEDKMQGTVAVYPGGADIRDAQSTRGSQETGSCNQDEETRKDSRGQAPGTSVAMQPAHHHGQLEQRRQVTGLQFEEGSENESWCGIDPECKGTLTTTWVPHVNAAREVAT